jgi:hypothetical protein
MNPLTNNVQLSLLGPYIFAPEILQERQEVTGYYNFYKGPAELTDPTQLVNDNMRGQNWPISVGLDYEPTQQIRNHTKKLIHKQARFMFSKTPGILIKPDDKKDKENTELLRRFIEDILQATDFWQETFKGFLDCTIGKRVLLACIANPGQPIRFRYYTMDEFTFETDPTDYKKLTKVIIAYMEKKTASKGISEQLWYRWEYYFREDGYCWLKSGKYNGLGKPVEPETDVNTLLTKIPCRVIINGGLTGDVTGTSDVKELWDLGDAYNQTTSDFRDALKFRMFEQAVFVNADPKSTKDLKIAPGAVVDLKTDPAIENGSADAKMLSSSFSFTEAAKEFLDRVKADMYELMDQPRPEDIKTVPSAKALKFTFYDLIGRCEEKWLEWEPTIKWAISMILETTQEFKLYLGVWQEQWQSLKYSVVIQHNYPIPEDEDEKKKTAIAEVTSNVRSHKAYIKDFSNEEDADGAFKEILDEASALVNAQMDQFQAKLAGESGGGASGN